MKKLLFAAAVASVGVVLAACQPTQSGTFQLSATGVAFQDGNYTWLASSGCGAPAEGFDYSGFLKDTAADGNGVFVQAKVDGYGWTPRIYHSGGGGTRRWIDRSNVHVDGDVCYHETGKVQVCQDRGTLFPDSCDTKHLAR
jgi:hypothetical protein